MKWLFPPSKIWQGRLGPTVWLFVVVLSCLFHGVFLPGQTEFSNDGPLGQLMAQCHQMPGRFTGCWSDLNNVGFNSGAAAPGISLVLQWFLGPVFFSKFYALVSLLILGTGAWCFFRQLRLTPLACVLGGLAAMLNSAFFSVACWGVAAQAITGGMAFFALAALVDTSSRQYWLRLILAGFAVGMGVTEGADVGAIFSLYITAFIIYQAWIAEGSCLKNTAAGLGRLVMVVVCAIFLAAQSIGGLVTTSIKGVAQMNQDSQTKSERWDWATQWSLPKREVLTLAIPGLFGYRIDTPEGGGYWGMVGRDPAWEKYYEKGSQGAPPGGLLRYTGGGGYAGVIVLLVGFWTVIQSLRRRDSVFSLTQRKWLWFWLGVGSLSLLLAFGRFAPFYQFFYALPYASAIRNPVKFLYPLSFALAVLFAFGVDGLERKYMQVAGKRSANQWSGLQKWWPQAAKFEKYWLYGCALVLLASLLAWFVYARHWQELEQYLQFIQVTANVDSVASFSIHQVGRFVLFFLLATSLLTLIFSGAFAGNRAGKGGFLLVILLLADLGLANQPWIIFWNYQEKYASNPIVDLLRDRPYEHRVVLPGLTLQPNQVVLSQLYQQEWLQHLFPFYNIQSFDVVQMSRKPEDFSAFINMLNHTARTNGMLSLTRAWQLTNTRYILAPTGYVTFWNRQNSLSQTPLRTITHFKVLPKAGVFSVTQLEQLTVAPEDQGNFGLFEFPAALPRAKLYYHWQVNTNDPAMLEQLFSHGFDPQASVLVDGGLLPDTATQNTNPSAPAVEFVRYSPKDLLLKAEASAPAVLLLNDHFDPNWKVLVDGKPEKLLRCNFLMRGVYLQPGNHTVEFQFLPPVRLLYVSVVAVVTAFVALGILVAFVYKNRLPIAPLGTLPTTTPGPSAIESAARNAKQRAPLKRKKEN